MPQNRTNSNRLKEQFEELYSLALAQRSLRLGLRAAWLIVAGTVLGWGLHAILGWLPNPLSWFLIGLVLALPALVGILSALIPESQWIWRIDQLLGFKGQASTAWEAVHKKQNGVLVELLVQDMLAALPRVRERVLSAGWYRKLDLIAALVVLMMGCILLASLLIRPVPPLPVPQTAEQNPPNPAPSEPAQAPQKGQGDQPGSSSSENNPSGNPSTENSQSGSDPQGGNQPGQDGASSADAGALSNTLRQLGSVLSQQAGTYDLGNALQNLDMQGAAKALEDLSQQLGDLSPETLNNLGQALNNAAGSASQAGNQPLSNDMNSAANALPSPDPDTSQALKQLANDLSQLGGGKGAAQSLQQPQTGASPAEPLSRLTNEGGDFTLPLDDPAGPSKLLQPASPNAPVQGTASGPGDAASALGTTAVNQNPLLPNTFSWKWRDVVSQYFQH